MGHIQNGIFQPFWKFTLSIVEEHDEKNLVFQPIWKTKKKNGETKVTDLTKLGGYSLR